MYKIFVVDDEQIVIDSITHIVKTSFQGADIVGTARSGREAIEKMELIYPDIVFMDINMPGINGIEAISEIKKRQNKIKFIILTAFDQFSYAKEALQLGVSEYLLKPASRNKIVEVLQKTISQVEIERENQKKELDIKEKLAKAIPIIENGFIYLIMLMDEESTELSNYRHLFNIEESGGYVMTIEFGDIQNNGEIGNKIGGSIRSEKFYPYVKECIKGYCKCFVGPVVLNRIVVFVPHDSIQDEYSERSEAVSLADKILIKLKENIKDDFKIGIGRYCSDYEQLPVSYNESLKAIRF